MSLFLETMKAEFRRIFTEPDIRLMLLGAPFLYSLLLPFAYMHGKVTEVPMGFVNQDRGHLARQIVREIDATEEVRVVNGFESILRADEALKREEITSFILIPRNFSTKTATHRTGHISLATNATNFSIANPATVATSSVVLNHGAKSLRLSLQQSGIRKAKAEALSQPLILDLQPVFNPESKYSFFFVPGMLYAIIQQIIIVSLVFSLTNEKVKVGRIDVPTRGRWLWVLAKIFPYALFNFVFTLLFAYTVLPMIGLPVVPWFQLPLLAAVTFLFTIASALVAFVLGLLIGNPVYAMIGLLFYSTPAYLISGMAWPSFNMTWPLRLLGILTPITSAGPTIRYIMLSPEVEFKHCLRAFTDLSIFSLVCFLAILLILRKTSFVTAK